MADETTHLPTHMPIENRPRNISRSVNDHTSRLDGVAKVTGRAAYTRDRYLDNQLFAGFIRCPWGQARLESFDRERALEVDGVVEVELQGRSGEYHGDIVGHIVAESKPALRRAMNALGATWRRRPSLTRLEDDMDDPPDVNAATRDLLSEAEHVFEATYTTPVQTHACLETHVLVVDHDGERATVYASTQGTSVVNEQVAEPLDLPQSKYEVVCEYVGGGFGSKFPIGREGQLAASIAAKYKRPVMCDLDRAEEHLDTGNRPSSRSTVRIGVNEDGTILGGRIHTWGGTGVVQRGGGVRFPSGRFDFGEIQKSHHDVSFNGGAPRPMRAPGHPQGAFAEELMVDEIAELVGVDPVEYRKRLDTSDARREMYDLGAELIGWNQREATGEQRRAIRRGFGVGSTTWGPNRSNAECEVVIHQDGSVEARTGTQDIGTGQKTIMGVLAAEHLGVPLRNVEVRIGRSTLPAGPPSGGSVTAPGTSPAMIDAAHDARRQLLDAIAEQEDLNADDLRLEGGNVYRGDERILEWSRAVRRMRNDRITGRGRSTGRDDPHWGEGHSDGVQFVSLSVDVETGMIRVDKVIAIQSCGRVVARKTAESQIIGGVIQGLSFALYEEKLLDRWTGAMVNPDLEMYKILGSRDMPHIVPVLWDKGQSGVRSLGEPPVIPTAGAVAGAVFNALGRPVRDLPLTPDKVLAALDSQGGDA